MGGTPDPTTEMPLDPKRGLQLISLAMLAAVAFLSRTSLGPLQETMRMDLALTDNEMAWLQGPPLALGVVGAIPLGLLIDRYSRVRLLLGLAVITVVANGLTAWASSFSWLFMARCLAGISAAAIWTAILSLVADWYPILQRGRATMIVSVGATAGISGAFGLGGALLGSTGSGSDGWRQAMLGMGVPLLAGVLLVLALKEPSRSESELPKPSVREVYSALWHRRALLLPLMLGFSLVGGIADGAAVVWAAPTLSRAFGLSAERVGAIMASIFLANGLLGPVLGGTLADLAQRKGGPYRTVTALCGLLFVVIPAGLFALAPTLGLACLGLLLFLLGGTAFQVAVLALTTIVIPSELRGSCMAWMLAIALVLAFGVAPLLVSHLSAMLGGGALLPRSMAIVCVGASVLGAVAFELGRHSFPECSNRARACA